MITSVQGVLTGVLFVVGDILLVNRPRLGEIMEILKAKVDI